ncbi:hypothetical protein BGZ59_001871, partial [Podila verticillata]
METLLPTLFFPTHEIILHTHLAGYCVSPAVQALVSADLANSTVDMTFEPEGYLNSTTDEPFSTNFFLDPVKTTLNGGEL